MAARAMLSVCVALFASHLLANDDPEPPKPGPIGVRLVAKKAKYVLDFGGEKKEDYVRLAKAGKVQPPRVELELVITNHTRENMRIRSSGSTNRLTLSLQGKGAVAGESNDLGVRQPIQYTILKPGEKLSIPIDRLANSSQVKKGASPTYHYWTEPGNYTLTASFYTVVNMDFNGKVMKSGYQTLVSKPLTIEVEK